MFKQTYSLTLTRDTAGKPTGVSNVATENVLMGAVKSIAATFSNDDVVVGAGRTLADAIKIAAPAYGTNRVLTGSWHFNPLNAG